MKTKNNPLAFVLIMLCLAIGYQGYAQISPPGSYTTLPGNSSVQTQTLSSSTQWFKYSTDSTHTAVNLKLVQQGSQYALSTVELYRFDGAYLNFVFRDTLRADSTIRTYATDLGAPETLYFKVSSEALVCGTCSGSLYPVVSMEVQALHVGCFGYQHPACQYVIDGSFDFAKIPCTSIPNPNNGACNYTTPNGYPACYWGLPLANSFIPSCSTFPVLGTSDYLYGCNTTYTAHSGPGFSGMHFYTQQPSGGGYAERNYREYVTQTLYAPLTSGQTYSLSLWVRRNVSFSWATSNIQVALSNGVYTQTSFNAITSPAGQVVNMTPSIVTSTNWTQLLVTFVANGNYTDITIGNFTAVGSSNASNQNPSETAAERRSAYYFIDDVSIKPANSLTVTPVNALACAGSTTTFTANMLSPGSFTYTPWTNPDPSLTYLTPNHAVAAVSPTATNQYYVTGVDQMGCTGFAFATVTVIPQPTVAVTPTLTTLCGNGSANLTATGATSYSWSTGSSSSSVTVSPSATTVYTVSGTTGNCPVSVATTTVISYPSLTVTAAPNVTACPGANTSLTAFGGTGSYTWSPGGATTASVIVTPTAPTVYTVSSSNGVCTLTTTILVNPVICCSVATTSLFTATSGTVSGGTYVLNSPLTLTGGLILSHVTIFMGTNAEIIIPNGMTLGLSTTHLLGCPQMWKGIRCTGSNASVYMVKSTLIEDAITAIDVANVTAPSYSTSILFLENSTFNKNYTSVNVENFDATAEHFPMFMGDMVFTSRKLITPDHLLLNPSLTVNYNWPVAANVPELKSITYFPATFNPDVNLQTGYEFSVASYSTANCEVPYSNSVAHQGIRVKNVYSTSNYNGFRMEGYNAPGHFDSFLFHNLFDNMHYGVNVTNSNFYACSSIYQYMSQYLVSYDPNFPKIKTYDGGVGINQVNTLATGLNGSQTFSMAVGPYTLGMNKTTNFFFNNPYGIKTENMQYATIAYNVFHSNRVYSTSPGPISIAVQVDRGQYGVYMKSVDYRNVNITQNFAANINNGIVFLANSNPIFGNLYAQMVGTVNIQYNRLKGNYGASITAGQSMAQAIAVDNLITPLLMNYANNVTVPLTIRNNTIALAFNGIAATNWNGQQVVNKINTISLIDNGFNGTSQYGIRHANNLADNVFGNTITGFNTTKVRVHGIYAAENKSQSVWCNSTENSYYGIVFAGSQNLTSWKSNTMKTHVQAMRLDNTTIGQQGGSGSPIANVWAGSWASGTYKTYVNGMDPGTPAGNSKLYMIAGVMPSGTENGAAVPGNRYKTIVPQSLFTTTGFSTVDCPASYSVSAAHNFPFLKANLGNIVTDAYDYSTYLNGNRKNGKLAVYRALMTDTSLVATDTILQQFKAASDVGTIGKFFALEQYLADGDLSNAENTLATISPADTVEYVLKRFYSIYFNSKTGAYDAADESDLITLATACPQQMGVGVYQARVLLNSLYDVYETYESDCGDTNNVAARKGRNSTKELSNMIMQDNFLVYPNPSDGIVYFTASNMGIASYQVMVYDIHGKCIFIKQYADGEKVNALDLDLSNGIYLMQLTDNSNGDVYQQKFVIQK